MKLTRAFCRFGKWFHILGQSCYPPLGETLITDSSCCRLQKLVDFIPCLVMLAVTTFLTIISCTFINYQEKFSSRIGSVLFVIGISTSISIVFTSVVQSVLHSSSFAMLFTQINDFERTITKDYLLNVQTFYRCFLKYLFIICGSSLLQVATVVRFKHLTWDQPILTSVILRTLSTLSTIHCLFYICLYDFMAKSFAKYVDDHGANTLQDTTGHIREEKFLKKEFDHYKLLHFKLWQIGNTIKQIFGWTLTVILFQNFVYGLSCVYYSLLVLFANGFDAEMLRK